MHWQTIKQKWLASSIKAIKNFNEKNQNVPRTEDRKLYYWLWIHLIVTVDIEGHSFIVVSGSDRFYSAVIFDVVGVCSVTCTEQVCHYLTFSCAVCCVFRHHLSQPYSVLSSRLSYYPFSLLLCWLWSEVMKYDRLFLVRYFFLQT